MEIITHAGIGLIAAAPMLNSRPELALGLVAGSVLPDLDALARVFGKRAFLRSHQTWSHAIPVQGAVSVLAGVIASACGAVRRSCDPYSAGFQQHARCDSARPILPKEVLP